MRRRPDILIPMLLSVGLHGSILMVAVRYADDYPILPAAEMSERELEDRETPPRTRQPIIRPSEESPPVVPEPEELERFHLGLETGTGEGIADSDSPLPHRALRAPTIQPGLSRDPVGQGGETPAREAPPSLILPPEQEPSGAMAQLGLPSSSFPLPAPLRPTDRTPPEKRLPEITAPDAEADRSTEAAEATPDGLEDVPALRMEEVAGGEEVSPPQPLEVAAAERADESRIARTPTPAGIPTAPPAVTPTEPRAEPATTPPRPSASAAPTQTARTPGDPLPQAELDSDPFEPEGSAVIVNGEVRARFGRAFKSVRPKLTFASYQDMLSVVHAKVVMRITTDAAGFVTKVDLLERTGKVAIDQPTEVAMYQWWFEPPKDANGNPQPHVFTFTVTYR